MPKDLEFIKRPLAGILERVSWEISCLYAGFTTVQVLKYILDSAFLQITGALEQKVKCIHWELTYNMLKDKILEGSNYDDNKYEILKTINNIKEGSSYDDKNTVLRMIGEEVIKGNKGSVNIEQKKYWYSEDFIKQPIKKFYNSGMLVECFQREIQEYKHIKMDTLMIDNKNITEKNNIYLLNNKEELNKMYNKAIKYRNHIAHNTKSKINNLPDFTELKNPEYKYENPFVRFAIMLLVDRTFIDIFEQYEKARKIDK